MIFQTPRQIFQILCKLKDKDVLNKEIRQQYFSIFFSFANESESFQCLKQSFLKHAKRSGWPASKQA